MCGIIGYIGNNLVEKELINGLTKLEYRGYDSSGILTINNSKFTITKSLGPVNNLNEKLSHYENTCCGIGHTRWATHGKVTLNNAHPHISNKNLFGLVHNGVIENYNILKDTYLSNTQFYSQTDSEVIVNLLEHFFITQKPSGNVNEDDLKQLILNCVIKTCSLLKGTYALAIVFNLLPKTIFIAKNSSPIFVATNAKNTFVSSDTICFAGKTNYYYNLKDNEYCIAEINNLQFFNKNGVKIFKKENIVKHKEQIIETNSQQSVMLREILQTPSTLLELAKNYKDFTIFKDLSLCNINKVVLIGCGTAYHSCLIGKVYFEHFCKIDATAYIASEFNSGEKIINKNTLCIFISQSGETFDTILAKKYCKNKKAKIIVITNVENSLLTKNVKYVLPVFAGKETAVASTKAYCCQIALLYLLAKFLANKNYFKALKQITKVAKKLKKFDFNIIDSLVNALDKNNLVMLLGKNLDYVTTLESCLKIKEVTYKDINAYPSGELKHGYIALIDNFSTAIIFASNKKLLENSLIACNEIKTRGGKTMLITSTKINKNLKKELDCVDFIVNLPTTDYYLSPITNIFPMQLVSEKIATTLGFNPDKPKNLAKSVTVK